MKTVKVLIIDGLNRTGLAIARALRMAGDYQIYVLAPAASPFDVIKKRIKSNSVEHVHFLKDLYREPVFTEGIIGAVERYKINAVIPTNQMATVWLSRAKTDLKDSAEILVEDYEKLIVFHHKNETIRMAKELGVPYPSTVFPRDIDEVISRAGDIQYPVVIKARKGSGASGVWYAENDRELITVYIKAVESGRLCDGLVFDHSKPFLQEYIPGELHDVVCLCIDGEIEMGLTQKRLITKPLRGGAGIVAVTTRNEELMDYASKIASASQWTGVMLLDFKIDKRDGRPKLLEVNPRFWGMTWLSVCAGYNFPHYLIRSAFNQPMGFPKRYRVGLVCRWPIMELQSIFERPLTATAVIGRAQGFMSRFRYGSCVYDIRLSDINPTIAQILYGLLRLCSRVVRLR